MKTSGRAVFPISRTRYVPRTKSLLTRSVAKEKKGKFGESLDFVEEGLYDVFWALVVTLRERLGDEVLVD